MLNQEMATDGPRRIADTVVIKSLHYRTILFEVEAVQLILKIGFVLRTDCPDEIYVLIRVESRQRLLIGVIVIELCKLKILNIFGGYYGIEMLIEFVFTDNLVSHCYS